MNNSITKSMVRERGKSLASHHPSSSSSSIDHNNGGKSSSSRNRLKVFAKRTMGLKKKMLEFTTLCGVDACMIVHGPNGEFDTWPENQREVKTIIQRYKSMNEEDREKHKLDLSSFIEAKKKKLETKIDQIRSENWSNSNSLYPTWDDGLNELPVDSLRDLGCLLESKLEKVRDRMEKKQRNRGDVIDRERNPNFENPALMGSSDFNQDSPLLPFMMISQQQPLLQQTQPVEEFLNFYSCHQQNHKFFPNVGGSSMSTMYNPGFGMVDNRQTLMGTFENSDFPSMPLLPVVISQPQPLQTYVPECYQIEDGCFNNNNYYYSHQQQQQDLDFKHINGDMF